MIELIQAVQCAALVAIAVAMWSGKLRGPAGPTGAPGASAPAVTALEPAARSAAVGLWEVLRLKGDTWAHASWVREGTPAWQQAFDTPGIVLRRGGDTVEGVQ